MGKKIVKQIIELTFDVPHYAEYTQKIIDALQMGV